MDLISFYEGFPSALQFVSPFDYRFAKGVREEMY
jgi:hypothetical protein